MLEGVAASAIAPRLRHLVHLPFTAWTGLGLLTAGLMWIACRWTSSPSARERLLVAASVAVLAALVTLPLAIAWVLHALALFFVVVVPGSRQSDGEPSSFSVIAQSIKGALLGSGTEASSKPAINEFQAILAATPPATAADQGQLLKQFMQWHEKPDPATPQRANP